MKHVVRLFALAVAFLAFSPAFAQTAPRSPANPCATVRCAASFCPPGQVRVGERREQCCSVAVCKPDPCATVRCAAVACPADQVKIGERKGPCCSTPICRPTTLRYCRGFYYKLCKTSADCSYGYRCSPPVADCQSSSCSCEPLTGATKCTADCRKKEGKCIR